MEYRSFRLVLASRLIFQTSTVIQLIHFEFLLQDALGSEREVAQQRMAIISFVTLGGGLLCALPSGMIADCVGLVPCAIFAIVLSSAVLLVLPLADDFILFIGAALVDGVGNQVRARAHICISLLALCNPCLALHSVTLPPLQRPFHPCHPFHPHPSH